MHLSRISEIFYIGVMLLLLSACATTGTESRGTSDSGDGSIDMSSSSTSLQEGLWNDKLWEDAPAPYVAGLKAAKNNRSSSAIKQFRKSIFNFPDFAPAYTNLGLQQLKLKDNTAATESFNKAIKLNEKDAVAFNHLGVIARQKGDFKNALKYYQKAITLKPDYANAHLNLGILLDLYLYDLKPALKQYETYQSLMRKKDPTVNKWIVELKRRIARGKK